MNKVIPKILKRQQEQLASLHNRKGSVPVINQDSLNLYSPRVEAYINHYFSITERKQLDPAKVKLVMDDYKSEAKNYFEQIKKSPSKPKSDPYNKDPLTK